TGTVHTSVHDRPLVLTHFVHLHAHGVGQALDHLGSEAHAHQFVQNGFLRFLIGRRGIAFGLESHAHLVEPFLDDVHLLHRLLAQALDLLAAHAAGRTVVVVLAGDTAARVVFAFLDHQAVAEFGDLEHAFADAIGVFEDLVHRGRAGGNRHHHVLEAVFDPLGNLDLALAGQEQHRTHST